MRKLLYTIVAILTVTITNAQFLSSATLNRQPAEVWDITNVPGAFYVLDFTNISTMFQEDATGVPVTFVTANNDPIGEIYDISPSGFHNRAEAAGRRPLLSSDGSRNSFAVFDGSNDFIRIKNSKKPFNKFVSPNPVWTMLFWVKKNVDGTTQILVDSNNGVTTGSGIEIALKNTNTIGLFLTDAGAQKVNFTTTQTLTIADGWTPVKIACNGLGAGNGHIKIGNKTEDTFTVVGGVSTDHTFEMVIGARSSSVDLILNSSVGAIIFSNEYISDTNDAWIKFAGWNKARNTDQFLIKDWEYNFSDVTKLWQNSGRTTPVSANNDPIAYVDNSVPVLFGPLNKDLSTATAITYKTNRQNGKSCADFNGSTSQINLQADFEAGGKWILVKVCKNRDAMLGSHIFYGTLYVPVTGSSYVGNVPATGGLEYTTLHALSGNACTVPLKNQGNAVNIIVYRRNGTQIDGWSGQKVKDSATEASKFVVTAIGPQINAGWEFDGEDYYDVKYSGYASDAYIQDIIIEQLNLFYGI